MDIEQLDGVLLGLMSTAFTHHERLLKDPDAEMPTLEDAKDAYHANPLTHDLSNAVVNDIISIIKIFDT